jgi:NADPH:quinone reductase-like Zn-dependent oxidoreductase
MTTMRRWVLKAGPRGPEGLVQEQVPVPQPGPGEVRVRVRAVSLNRRDLMVLTGVYGRPSARDLVPISDGAGEIEAVGPGVDRWTVGDRVAATYFANWVSGPPHPQMGLGLGAGGEDGMLAEYVVLPADRLVRVPSSLDWAEAATLPCAALTAWNALHGGRPLQPDGQVLVLGTGGVSIFALLFARSIGARVIATSSQAAKLDRLRALGAADTVNYRDEPAWGQVVFARTGGVDKVVEIGGAGSMNQSLAAIRPGGEVAMIGFLAKGGEPPDPYLLMGKGAIIRGIAVGSVEMFDAMAGTIERTGLKPPVDRRFAFDDSKAAYEAQAAPHLFGKIVIDLA